MLKEPAWRWPTLKSELCLSVNQQIKSVVQQAGVEVYTMISCFSRRGRICASRLTPSQFINHFVFVTPEAASFALHRTAALFVRLSAAASVPKQIILTCILSAVQRIHSPYFTTGNVSNSSSNSLHYLCRSLQLWAPFARKIYLTRTFNLGIMDTSWKRSTFTSTRYLFLSQCLSVKATLIHGISHVEPRLEV